MSMFLFCLQSGLGLNPLCNSIALSLLDAFHRPNDYGLSDRTKSRFGRRIPYMFMGLFGFSLGIFLLFNVELVVPS